MLLSAILTSGCSAVRTLFEAEPEPESSERVENPVAVTPPAPKPENATVRPPVETVVEVTDPVEPAPDDPPALPAPELGELYAKGAAAMKAGSHDDALLYWRLVWETDPGYADVRALLTHEYQVRGLEAYSRRNIDQAIRLWGRALEIDPLDAKTIAYIDHAEGQKTRIEEIPSELRPTE